MPGVMPASFSKVVTEDVLTISAPQTSGGGGAGERRTKNKGRTLTVSAAGLCIKARERCSRRSRGETGQGTKR